MFVLPVGFAAKRTPADLLFAVAAGYVLVCHPELSAEGAGSCAVSPDRKLPATPPTREAMLLPTDELVVPVEVSLSGTGLLKFHRAMVSARGPFTAAVSTRVRRSFLLKPLCRKIFFTLVI